MLAPLTPRKHATPTVRTDRFEAQLQMYLRAKNGFQPALAV
jgi:hypothetical protein